MSDNSLSIADHDDKEVHVEIGVGGFAIMVPVGKMQKLDAEVVRRRCARQ